MIVSSQLTNDVSIQEFGQASDDLASNLALKFPPRTLVEVVEDSAVMVVSHLAKLHQPVHDKRRNTTLLHSAFACVEVIIFFGPRLALPLPEGIDFFVRFCHDLDNLIDSLFGKVKDTVWVATCFGPVFSLVLVAGTASILLTKVRP